MLQLGATKPGVGKMGRFCMKNRFYARDSGTLEQLKELSTRRQAIQDSIKGIRRITPIIA